MPLESVSMVSLVTRCPACATLFKVVPDQLRISEGWVRVQAGKAMDRKGNPLTIKLNGAVEAWFEDLGEGAPVAKL